MKKTVFIFSIALLGLLAFAATACGNKAAATDDHAEAAGQDMPQGDGEHAQMNHDNGMAMAGADMKNGFDGMPAPGTKAVCPVMGDEFEVKADSPHSEYKGKTWVFCCPSCKPSFDADPEKYISKQ